jgi:pumilio RNA-binding family
VVQKAFEVAETAAEREALAKPLQGHVVEAAISPHANHVLQKCIEVLPANQVQFVLQEMKGNAVAAARHRYGCRVLERLIEHCPWTQTADLVEEVLDNASQLCRHTFGTSSSSTSLSTVPPRRSGRSWTSYMLTSSALPGTASPATSCEAL